jgi:hypothetical protein
MDKCLIEKRISGPSEKNRPGVHSDPDVAPEKRFFQGVDVADL